MGLLQGARQNPGAPEDEEWGLQSPLAGLWFGRFAVLPLRSFAPRASPVWVEALGASSNVTWSSPQSRRLSLQMRG